MKLKDVANFNLPKEILNVISQVDARLKWHSLSRLLMALFVAGDSFGESSIHQIKVWVSSRYRFTDTPLM